MSVSVYKSLIPVTIKSRQGEQERDHRPHFVIPLLRRPRGHAGELDSMLDDVEQLLGLPQRNLPWQIRGERGHPLGDFRQPLSRTSVTGPTASFVMARSFQHCL